MSWRTSLDAEIATIQTTNRLRMDPLVPARKLFSVEEEDQSSVREPPEFDLAKLDRVALRLQRYIAAGELGLWAADGVE